MRYPTMGQAPRNAVSIPALSGGVNKVDALNKVDDNQMIDCQNVWFRDGMLQTRPALQYVDITISDVSISEGDVVASLTPQYIKNTVFIDEIEYRVSYINLGKRVIIDFVSVSKIENNAKRFELKITDIVSDNTLTFNGFAFYNENPTLNRTVTNNGTTTTTKGKGLYIFASYKNDYVLLYELAEVTTELNVDERFVFLHPSEIYSPLVYVNGKSEGFKNYANLDVQTKFPSASFFEGYNAITNARSVYSFTTDTTKTPAGGCASNRFGLPVSLKNKYISIEYTDPVTGKVYESSEFAIKEEDQDGNRAFSVEEGVISSNATTETVSNIPVFFDVLVNSNTIFFFVKKPDGSNVGIDEPWFNFKNAIGVLANNLKIKLRPLPASYCSETPTATKSNLARMTVAMPFGSTSEGIFGGNRVFLSGSNGAKKNMLAWSDLDNPTYFSENNYVHVGSSEQQITNLAKQDTMLVIFKQNEIFYTVKTAGTSYSAEDVVSGNVVDVTTLDNTFPIVQIHSGIGCDKPLTVQLCGSRLVWTHKDNVYMLRSANQYSAVNVSKISNLLGKISLSRNSSATTYDGHYLLLSANYIYVLDYDQYYFNSLPSYSDTKKANRKLQWHIWKIPERGTGKSLIMSSGDKVSIHSLITTVENENVTSVKTGFWFFDDEQEFDLLFDGEKAEIESIVQTKLFDFGAMERLKSIEQIYINFGQSKSNVNVQYLTERGALDELTVDITDTVGKDSLEFIKTKRMLPGIKRSLRFGVKIMTNGKVKLGGMLIKFKYMGVTR